jgi:hypothetical protein
VTSTLQFESKCINVKNVLRNEYIVTRISIARQRVGEHIPETHAHATIGRLFLGNGRVNTHP